MKILFYFGHPAQYLFLRATMHNLLKDKGYELVVLIKTKDVLENLVANDGFEYINILPVKRGKTKLSVVTSFIKRIFLIFPVILKSKPDLLVGEDASIAILGKLFKIDSITITEDDYDVIKDLASITYPFSTTIICPTVCGVNSYEYKKIGYYGYMKLGYLHPNVFKPNPMMLSKYNINERYILIRLANLNAFHDFDAKGITQSTLDELIKIAVDSNYSVFISSEITLDDKYEQYSLRVSPKDFHHILAHADLLICDSQSMSVEASVLGIPSIRFSSFVGKISVLEELEHKYGLTFGIDPSQAESLISKTRKLLKINNLKESFRHKRSIMLKDKIDVTAFMTWFLSNYPLSRDLMKKNPDRQFEFK